MRIKVGMAPCIIFLAFFLSYSQYLAAQTEQDMPAVKVAMSDDHSIIVGRVLYTALKLSGYQMVSKVTGMRTAVADVNYGDAAILPTQTGGWEIIYPNLIKVPVAIDNVEFSVYTRSGDSYQFTRWSDMAGLNIGYRWQNEYVVNNIWRAEAGGLISLNDLTALWASLLNGETDAVILPRMSYFEHRLPQGIKRAGIIERQPVYSYVHNSHDYLVPLLEKAYQEMYADGTIERIHYSRTISDEKPAILYINSYNTQNDWERRQMESIRQNIEYKTAQMNKTALVYYTLNLNSNELHSQENFNSIISDMIRTEFITRYPDLVISSGNEAFEFVLNNYYLLFPNLPVLFFGVHGLNSSMLYGLEENVTGVSETVSFTETVQQMLRLFPSARRIYILNDYFHLRSIRLRDEILDSIKNLHGFSAEFVFNENKPLTDIIEDIKMFDSGTLVLIGSYLSDSNRTFFSEHDVQTLIAEASVNPVFCLTSSYIGGGVFGGMVSATDEQNKAVASMAVDILNGIEKIPVVFNSAYLNQWQFDYQTAARFNVDLKKLPAGHVIINRSLPIWESNPLEFRLMLTVAALILLFICALMAYIYNQIKKKADKVYITNIEKAQDELRQARDAAEAANKTKTIFLANMSHEIRTPMNSIIGFAELAQYSGNSQKTKNYLSYIEESAKWLLKIINDILDVSKIESGKIVLERIPFDLNDVLAYCRMTVKPKADDKGITFYIYAEPFGRTALIGDPFRLRQVIVNLLSNAVKFTNTGTVKLLISPKSRGDDSITLHFEVKDSGIGMSSEQILKVMEPFTQADSSVMRRFGGTGLGLSISKNIIELMGGTLIVESALLIGSSFSFDLTFETAVSAQVDYLNSQQSFQDIIEKPNFSGEVLVCEDNTQNQRLIMDHLAMVGLKTVIAHNGREGVEFAAERAQSQKPFDLIFMDIHMPEMDGLQASSKIIAMGVKTPIVAMTANIMPNDIDIYDKCGMSSYIGKPYTSQELWKCLIKYLPVVSYSAVDKSQQYEAEKKNLEKARINFVKYNRTTFAEIVKALQTSDIKKAHRLVHTLKSNSGLIGEKKLQAAAADAEKLLAGVLNGEAEDGTALSDKDEINILETEMKMVLEKMAPMLAETEAGNLPKTRDAEKIRKILFKLEPMLINRNPECEDLLTDILIIPGADELARYTERFMFKQALTELTKLKQEWR